MLNISKKMRREIVDTPDDDLVARFPKFNRGQLRAIKIQVRKENKKNPLFCMEKESEKNELAILKDANKELTFELVDVTKKLEAVRILSCDKKEYKIDTSMKGGTVEAVPVIMLSDWHVEERVDRNAVNGLNEYTLDIADKRINHVFNNCVTLLKMVKKDVKINSVIVAILGDMISGNIHEELLENCQLRPIDATLWVQRRLISGINLLLSSTDLDFTIVCKSGNHSRITDKIHVSTESGNSLEFYMYNVMAEYFKDEKRIKFIIDSGYHTYVNVFGKLIRFHHGHNMRYMGGIGGIFIPAYKAISQWNKGRVADLDCFGHFHSLKNGGTFISNGSVIGYGPYSVRIKADYEIPSQKFFMFTPSGQVIGEYPIFTD